MNRRNFLIKSLTATAFVTTIAYTKNIRKNIRFRGKILVNGKPLSRNTKITANSIVQTRGKNSVAKFVIGKDAFRVGENAKVSFKGKNKVSSIRVYKGTLLGAFKKGRKRKITTTNATMGIRGTAVFVDAISKDKTGFCTCYGKTLAYSSDNISSKRKLEATHHKMVYIENQEVHKASVFHGLYEYLIHPSHTDVQLRELEAMVGRIPAFDKNGRPFIEL